MSGPWAAKNAKSEMVWLGHSIRVTEAGHLAFTETRMRQRFADVRNKISNVFQYIGDIGIRMKIWKTYVSPVIEWFCPLAFTKPHHMLASSNELEVFQQLTLCWTMKVSRFAPRIEVDETACERPTKMRCMMIAARLTELAARSTVDMARGSTAEYASTMSLRGGKTKAAEVCRWPAVDNRDIGDRMFVLANIYEELDPEILAKFDKKDKDNHRKFDPVDARKWARVTNGLVRYRANRRRHETL